MDKKFSSSGALPLTSHQGLCPWTLLYDCCGPPPGSSTVGGVCRDFCIHNVVYLGVVQAQLRPATTP